MHARETNPRLVWSIPEKFPTPNRRNLLLVPFVRPATCQTFRYNDALSTGPSVDKSAISILATSDAITTSPMDLSAILNVVLGKAKYSRSTLLDRNWPSARSRCFITQIDWPCKWCNESVQSRKPPLAPGILKYLYEESNWSISIVDMLLEIIRYNVR